MCSEFYENSAVMLEEEGAVIVGLLVGLNVIDANLCVKGEDLDTQVWMLYIGCCNNSLSVWKILIVLYRNPQVGVIDFSMYLKNDIDDYRSEER